MKRYVCWVQGDSQNETVVDAESMDDARQKVADTLQQDVRLVGARVFIAGDERLTEENKALRAK
jgi:hypothetical protein